MSEGFLSQMLWPLPHTTARELAPTARIYQSARIASTVKHLVMEEGTMIGDFCFVSVPELLLARGAQVNSGTRIVGRHLVGIGMDSVVSYGCTLITTSDSTEAHFMNDATPEAKRIFREGTIDIGPRVFVGAHSIIMPGIEIFPGVAVRAFSYVNESLTMHDGIYGGQPARLIRHRSYR